MSKVFGIVFILFSGSTVFAQSTAVDAETLMKSIDSTLDAVIRCEYVVAPVGSGTGNMIGKEIGVFFKIRKIRKNYIIPLINKTESLKTDVEASGKIVREVELFEARLLENALFTKCPGKTAEFFKSVKSYIEFTTAK